ncbi:MAG: DUF7450 family protein [Rubripirellula sp.]
MSVYVRLASLLLPCVSMLGTTAEAHTPVDFLEVLEVKPAQMIEHGVQLKTRFDAEPVPTDLRGPKFFSQAIGALGRDRKTPLAYLNWFSIANVKSEPVRSLAILDMVRGSTSKNLTIGDAQYFLSTAQRITSGAPEPIPDGLDLYKAYRVMDGGSVDLDLEMTGAVGTSKRTVGKPLFVCLPTAEWHHDERFTPSHPKDCFVVYELNAGAPLQRTFSTIDQFGLNELEAGDKSWICVRAAFLRVNEK